MINHILREMVDIDKLQGETIKDVVEVIRIQQVLIDSLARRVVALEKRRTNHSHRWI
jgi:hypothetical protein